jgi:hypothetical protein
MTGDPRFPVEIVGCIQLLSPEIGDLDFSQTCQIQCHWSPELANQQLALQAVARSVRRVNT